jgi:hypothetical protein
MDYKDALAACLDAVRAGQDVERAIASYPEYSARLREDLTLAAAIRAYSMAHAGPPDQTAAHARQRLAGELASLRAQRSARSAGRTRSFSWPASLRGLGVAVAAVAAIGLLAFGPGYLATRRPPKRARSRVVVERTDAGLVLQTADGIQDVFAGPDFGNNG